MTESPVVPPREGISQSGEGINQNRQAVMHCPYCAEEDLFPIEHGGWECRACRRAFSVKFLGLTSPGRSPDRSPR